MFGGGDAQPTKGDDGEAIIEEEAVLIEEIQEPLSIKQISTQSMGGSSSSSANTTPGTKDETLKDRHPEKRMKQAFAKFEEERLAELKEEYPTLKMSQLKERIWKEVSKDWELLDGNGFYIHQMIRNGQ